MKILASITLLFSMTLITSCSDKPLVINDLKNSNSDIYITKQNTEPTNHIIIYNLENNFSQLSTKSIGVKTSNSLQRKDVINAFIKHSNLKEKGILLQLLKIEELDNEATYYMSYTDPSDHASIRPLVEEALEMTILRNLKTKNFSIVYTESADL